MPQNNEVHFLSLLWQHIMCYDIIRENTQPRLYLMVPLSKTNSIQTLSSKHITSKLWYIDFVDPIARDPKFRRRRKTCIPRPLPAFHKSQRRLGDHFCHAAMQQGLSSATIEIVMRCLKMRCLYLDLVPLRIQGLLCQHLQCAWKLHISFYRRMRYNLANLAPAWLQKI